MWASYSGNAATVQILLADARVEINLHDNVSGPSWFVGVMNPNSVRQFSSGFPLTDFRRSDELPSCVPVVKVVVLMCKYCCQMQEFNLINKTM